jgi:hypothetical protein
MRVVSGSPSPEDVDAISRRVQGLYEWISGPAGARDSTRLSAMFVPEGRLSFSSDAGASWRRVTTSEFTDEINARLVDAAFYESEVDGELSVFGRVAHVFSSYESRRSPGEQPFARGVNSIQLVRFAGDWRVLSMCWDQA